MSRTECARSREAAVRPARSPAQVSVLGGAGRSPRGSWRWRRAPQGAPRWNPELLAGRRGRRGLLGSARPSGMTRHGGLQALPCQPAEFLRPLGGLGAPYPRSEVLPRADPGIFPAVVRLWVPTMEGPGEVRAGACNHGTSENWSLAGVVAASRRPGGPGWKRRAGRASPGSGRELMGPAPSRRALSAAVAPRPRPVSGEERAEISDSPSNCPMPATEKSTVSRHPQP